MAQHDITQHGDDELIDQFINDEYLNDFAAAVDCFEQLEELAGEMFTYNAEQAGEFVNYYNKGHFND